MNPLTLVKRLNKINSTEASLGISEEASWHAKYKESAYVFVGGIPFDLTEGDLLAVFAQYGEVVDVNLVRDKGTGKSKGFAFIAYEDQRSTILAVDNLNGAKLLGRIVRVDHVSNYKKKEEEDEEKEQQKREARGVCRAFQRGDCTRGAGCKFSHDEQRSANTGWGAKDTTSRWDHDKYNGPSKNQRKSAYAASDHIPGTDIRQRDSQLRSDVKDGGRSSAAVDDGDRKNRPKQNELILNGRDRRGIEKKPEWRDKEPTLEEDLGRQKNEKQSGKHVSEGRDGQGSRKRSRYDEDETEENPKDRYTRAGDKQLGRHESEVRDMPASKKSSRHDEDKVEENLKDRYVRSSDKWSGRQETDQSKKVEKSGRRSENHSRHDGDGSERRSGQHDIEDNPKDNFDRQGSERRSRYDVMDTEPYAKEDRSMRENVKTSRHHSSRHRREEDASPRKRVHR